VRSEGATRTAVSRRNALETPGETMISDSIPAPHVPERKAKPGLQFVISVTAAIVGALAPGLIGDATPEARLGGMVAASVLPLVVTWAGPWQPLRVGLGVALAVGAMVLTYVGGTAVDRDAFPVPEPVAETAPEPTPTVAPVPPNESDKGSIRVSPNQVDCSDGSCEEVTVTNVGPERLSVAAEVEDDAHGEFSTDGGCDQPLEPGADCAIAVTFASSETDGQRREATLRIGHDGSGLPKAVRLSAVAPAASDVGVRAATGAQCTYTDAGELVVPFALSATGDDPGTVTVIGRIGDFATGPKQVSVADEEVATLTFPEASASGAVFIPGATSVATIALDPAVDEPDNDVLELVIPVPDVPQTFECLPA